MRHLLLLPLAVAALALALASSAGADTKTIQITKAGFVPATTSIAVGDTVTWHNADTVNHQVVANNGSFASPVLKPGETYSVTFSKQGTTAYRDALHTSLKGSVAVSGPPAGVTLSAASSVVTYGAGTTLSGSISSQQSNQWVVLNALPFGEKTAKQANVASTTTNGAFQFGVSPTIRTTYTAQWSTATSSPVTVYVRPRLGLGVSGRLFTAKATSDLSYAGHYVLVQRRRVTSTSWFSVKKVFLGASSRARFRLVVPRGRWYVRLYLPAAQAGDGYLASTSRLVAVLHR
jgi:plastocyanin